VLGNFSNNVYHTTIAANFEPKSTESPQAHPTTKQQKDNLSEHNMGLVNWYTFAPATIARTAKRMEEKQSKSKEWTFETISFQAGTNGKLKSLSSLEKQFRDQANYCCQNNSNTKEEFEIQQRRINQSGFACHWVLFNGNGRSSGRRKNRRIKHMAEFHRATQAAKLKVDSVSLHLENTIAIPATTDSTIPSVDVSNEKKVTMDSNKQEELYTVMYSLLTGQKRSKGIEKNSKAPRRVSLPIGELLN
jgi:hypothetical protein